MIVPRLSQYYVFQYSIQAIGDTTFYPSLQAFSKVAFFTPARKRVSYERWRREKTQLSKSLASKYLFVEHIHMNMVQSKNLYANILEHTSIIT